MLIRKQLSKKFTFLLSLLLFSFAFGRRDVCDDSTYVTGNILKNDLFGSYGYEGDAIHDWGFNSAETANSYPYVPQIAKTEAGEDGYFHVQYEWYCNAQLVRTIYVANTDFDSENIEGTDIHVMGVLGIARTSNMCV